MNILFKHKNTAIEKINLEDTRFRITTRKDIEALADSIKKTGLINPPILLKKNSFFLIICGFRRINACISLGLSHIDARIVDTDSVADCIRLAITDNTFQRPLNLVEQSRSISILLTCAEEKDLEQISGLEKIAGQLGLPSSLLIIKKIKKISHLSEKIQNHIIAGIISLPIALELEKLTFDESDIFTDIFAGLKLGLNRQKELITLVKEIAFKSDTTIKDVLQDKSVKEILMDEDKDRKEKQKALRLYLKQKRFPTIFKAESRLAEKIKSLKIGAGIKLVCPENFEGNTFVLNLFFKNFEELKIRKVSVDKMVNNPETKEIFSI